MKTLIILSFLLASGITFSQSDPQTIMYWNQYTIYNPATSGLEYKHDFRASYHTKNPSLSFSPQNYTASYNTRLKGHHGVGVNYSYDESLASDRNSINLNYNYQFTLKGGRRISLGVSPGFFTKKRVNIPWMNYPQLNNDYLNLNTGVAYMGKKIYAGVSLTHVLHDALKRPEESFYSVKQELNAHARYTLRVMKKATLHFEGIVNSDFIFTSVKLNARVRLYDQFVLGAGYRLRDAIAVNVGWDIKKRYRLAYAYSHTSSKLSRMSVSCSVLAAIDSSPRS